MKQDGHEQDRCLISIRRCCLENLTEGEGPAFACGTAPFTDAVYEAAKVRQTVIRELGHVTTLDQTIYGFQEVSKEYRKTRNVSAR